MKKICAAYYCLNKGVYYFPDDIKLRKLWEEALIKNKWNPDLWWRPMLCPAHFTPDDYLQQRNTDGQKILKKTAVPSIFFTDGPPSAPKLPKTHTESETQPERPSSDDHAPGPSNGVTTDSQPSATNVSELYTFYDSKRPNPRMQSMYKCNACKQQFETYCLQFRHQVTHKNFCTVCSESFATRRHLKNHICDVCHICNQNFTRKRPLDHHRQHTDCQYRTHGPVRFLRHEECCLNCLTCPYCAERSMSPAHLRKHIVKCQADIKISKKIIHVCNVCGEKFVEGLEMVGHMRQHSGPVRSYSRAKRPLAGAVDRITDNERQNTVPDDNGTGRKVGIDVKSPVLPIGFENIKKEPEETKIDINVDPLVDIHLKNETGDLLDMAPQAEELPDIVQEICSEWSDVKEEMIELQMVKEEAGEICSELSDVEEEMIELQMVKEEAGEIYSEWSDVKEEMIELQLVKVEAGKICTEWSDVNKEMIELQLVKEEAGEICSEWSDVKEEIIELQLVKVEAGEA